MSERFTLEGMLQGFENGRRRALDEVHDITAKLEKLEARRKWLLAEIEGREKVIEGIRDLRRSCPPNETITLVLP